MSSTETAPDPLVLAAIDRAERHNPAQPAGVPVWRVYDHLSIAKRSGPARRVRARLDALERAGSLVRSRRHGVPIWALTSTGRRRLTRAQGAGDVPALPESPQHRQWRDARTLAARGIERFQLGARDDVEAATDLLDALVFDVRPAPLSDVWFELGERLARSFRRLGSAAYCLHEWAEPDDARADIDDGTEPSDAALDEDARTRAIARRAGRRNIRLWDTPARETK